MESQQRFGHEKELGVMYFNKLCYVYILCNLEKSCPSEQRNEETNIRHCES